jgi:hypothetical protein
MPGILAARDGALVLAQARRHLESVAEGLHKGQELLGRVDDRPVVDLLVAVVLFELGPQMALVQED